VHARPAALEGRDGFSYSIEIVTDETGDATRPIGAFLLFVQWSRLGAQRVEGHVESGFLAFGDTPDAASAALGAMSLADAQAVLDGLLRARNGDRTRRWWSATERTDGGGGDPGA
jgi:hypothetical protein